MSNLLKKQKIRETPFRKAVLEAFIKYNNAIPLSVVEEELKTFDRTTLYRTIKLFLEKGIIHEIKIIGEESNYALCQKEYEINTHYHQHIHFKCRNCGIIYCVEVDKFPSINLPKYKIEQLEIQATGLCKNCNV